MHIITYFGFTLVSVLIQFCVMDYINESIEQDKNLEIERKVDTKRNIQSAVKKLSDKPHALFYRTDANTLSKSVLKIYNNASLSEFTTTEWSSTILDWEYDENATTTEDSFQTTDMFTSTEFENITEITLFDNKTHTKSNKKPKQIYSNKICSCNILYKICDINCCCDSDCTEIEINLFSNNCGEKTCQGLTNLPLCGQKKECNKILTSLENLFCISKTNLPSRRLTDIQFDEAAFNRSPKWHKHNQQEEMYEFKNSVYKYQEPVWFLKNESIFYTDIPLKVSNNYCSGKKPIKFLVNEDVICIVKLQDLHMFQVFSIMEGARIVSPVINSTNTTVKNTFMHQTDWIFLICDDTKCATYNKSRHEPSCTVRYCKNIATTVKYNLFYYDSKIMKAILKLYTQKVLLHHSFIQQRVKVQFYLSNKTESEITKLSGNPGYIWNLPIIISTAENNHTLNFFNWTCRMRKFLTYPENRNGICVFSNVSYQVVNFGHNKRSKCRYNVKQDKILKNATGYCQAVQNSIYRFLKLDSTIYVSRYGNPQENRENDWIKITFDRQNVYGSLEKNSVVRCYNLVTRIAYVIAYADINSENSKEKKIVHVNIEGTAQNITFSADDASAVLTVDASFADASEPDAFEYAGAPHLQFYLPKSFFLPSNTANYIRADINFLTPILLCSCIRLT